MYALLFLYGLLSVILGKGLYHLKIIPQNV
jgi:hypothetical protein